MGSSFSNDDGSMNKSRIAGTALSAAAGGLNAASGNPPPRPVDFSGIAAKFKKHPAIMGYNGGPDVIPKQEPDVGVPDFNVGASPMPDLYSGTNAQIPQLRKSAPQMPFYGGYY